MKVIIAGAGEVGLHLAKLMAFENHDVTIVDANEERYRMASTIGDLVAIEASSTSISALKGVDIKKADLFIAVNPAEDQDMNITSALLAKKLGAKKVIARINNGEYLLPNNIEMFLDSGIDYLFYPEQIASNEIIKMLGQTSSTEYVDFSGGELLLTVLKLEEGAPIINKPVNSTIAGQADPQYKTIAISREGKTIIPKKDEVFEQNDMVYILANHTAVPEVLQFSGKTNIRVRDLMILGGGKIGVMVAKALEKHTNIKLIENNREKCEVLTDVLEHTLILSGDGRSAELLMEEEVGNMDAFVAVTGSSETNILACMAAKQMGVKKTIAEIENIDYIKFAETMGVDTVINKKLITASSIYRFTMDTDIQAIKYLIGSDAEVLEFVVKPGSPSTKGKIAEIDFPEGSVIGGIVRGDQSFIATGDSEIKPYDRVVVFSLPSVLSKIGGFFT
ncbi:MAG: Trk system potassium transporter TrkA [Prevotellaceae bacterium]|jgi:trk system potassium uptake protein TrkA|nr:Trk system potassium transporter TrkA [Prevotellaceae bacterium]